MREEILIFQKTVTTFNITHHLHSQFDILLTADAHAVRHRVFVVEESAAEAVAHAGDLTAKEK